MGEQAHTPLPWRVGDREPYVEIWGPMRRNNHPILVSMESEPRKANAELIVRAVNSHADLLAALKEAEKELAQTITDLIGCRADNTMGVAHSRFDEVSQQELARVEVIRGLVRAAITKAEGR